MVIIKQTEGGSKIICQGGGPLEGGGPSPKYSNFGNLFLSPQFHLQRAKLFFSRGDPSFCRGVLLFILIDTYNICNFSQEADPFPHPPLDPSMQTISKIY